MTTYIDVPNGYRYKYKEGDVSGTDSMRRTLGVKTHFMFNSLAGYSKGDVYEVDMDISTSEDKLAFKLKYPEFEIINLDHLQSEIERRYRKRG